MAAQKADLGRLAFALQIEVSAWYFDLRIRDKLLLGSLASLQVAERIKF